MHHPRIAHTTAFVTPVVEHWLEREIAECVHHEDDSTTHRTMNERSYHGATSRSLSIYDFILLHIVNDHTENEKGKQLSPLDGLI